MVLTPLPEEIYEFIYRHEQCMNAQKVHTFATVVTSNDPMFNLTHNNVEHQLALVKKVLKKNNTKLLLPLLQHFTQKLDVFVLQFYYRK